MKYSIRPARVKDHPNLVELHKEFFIKFQPDFNKGWWWVIWTDGEIVGFAGMTPSDLKGGGYLKRSGVLSSHRGNGLQKRLIRIRERKARKEGFTFLVTDTTDNVHSANNLISCGFKVIEPEIRWAFKNSIYFRKEL